MPTYEYRCDSCGVTFEQHESMTAPAAGRCPECRGSATRLISGGTGFILKGAGSGHGSPNAAGCSLEREGRTCCGRQERCGKPACG